MLKPLREAAPPVSSDATFATPRRPGAIGRARGRRGKPGVIRANRYGQRSLTCRRYRCGSGTVEACRPGAWAKSAQAYEYHSVRGRRPTSANLFHLDHYKLVHLLISAPAQNGRAGAGGLSVSRSLGSCWDAGHVMVTILRSAKESVMEMVEIAFRMRSL